MPSLLPTALIALLFAWPCVSQGISSNDPFRAIAVTLTKPEPPPVCCLKALTGVEPLDDEVLLSFEDWKKKQAAQQNVSPKRTDGNNQNSTIANGSNASNTHNEVAPPNYNVSTDFSDSLQPPDVAPHFRVPIIDRFNYANIDCSGRVHTSHKSAKSPSSILSSKKDRYMLSPCNSGREKQFVVVELCDDIRIDTVQLANFEFFSGVFKDLTVSVAKTYSIDPDGWLPVGTYRAKNVRGVQSFHPPTSLRDFYRFIRIDFLSHYGNEYYCPVSLLRVYGLTHLEEWKWDIWQAESRAKLEKGAVPAVQVMSMSLSVSSFSTGGKATHSAAEPTTVAEMVFQETGNPSATTSVGDASSTGITLAATTQSSMRANTIGSSLPHSQSSMPVQDFSRLQTSSSLAHTSSPVSKSSHTSVLGTSKTSEPIASSLSDAHRPQSSDHSTLNIPSSIIIPSHSSIPSTQNSSSVVQSQSPPPSPLPAAGESVYRTIMNRLTAVENNQTLYMKYVEQQNGAVRDMIRRLGEDVGRMEGITRGQGLALQKAVNEWEKQRYQLQMEYKDAVRRMEILSHEIILEKRLGVAQLCLLLAVLIFLSLTRGSRANDPLAIGQLSLRNRKSGGLREWGRRHLSWTEHSLLARKSSETTDRGGWKEGNKSRNKSPHRMKEKSDTRSPIKRPKPLVLAPSNKNNILRAFSDDAENTKLPFPSSEPPPPRTTLGSTVNRPRTRTISHPRSRAGSGSSTPLYSAHTSGNGRRMVFQRPVTPNSRSHFVFRTPQGRSHSFSRSATPIRPADGSFIGPIPLAMSQTSSWSGTVGVVPKSAKNWARTAHLHDVKSVKKRHEEHARIELARFAGKNKRESMEMGDTVDDEDDVFLEKRLPNIASMVMRSDDGSGVLSNKRHVLLELAAEDSLVFPVGEESDLWVDTDSTSVDDGNAAETFDPFELENRPILRISRSADDLVL